MQREFGLYLVRPGSRTRQHVIDIDHLKHEALHTATAPASVALHHGRSAVLFRADLSRNDSGSNSLTLRSSSLASSPCLYSFHIPSSALLPRDHNADGKFLDQARSLNFHYDSRPRLGANTEATASPLRVAKGHQFHLPNPHPHHQHQQQHQPRLQISADLQLANEPGAREFFLEEHRAAQFPTRTPVPATECSILQHPRLPNFESPTVENRRPATADGKMDHFKRTQKASVRYELPESPLPRYRQPPSSFPLESGVSNEPAYPHMTSGSAAQESLPRARSRGNSGASSISDMTVNSPSRQRPLNHVNRTHAATRTSSLRYGKSGLGTPPWLSHSDSTGNFAASGDALPSASEEKSNVMRSSFRSRTTASTAQGTFSSVTGIDRSSMLTKTSSVTESLIINSYTYPSARSSIDDGPSLDDVMGMYEHGFQDDSDMEEHNQFSRRFPLTPPEKGGSRPLSRSTWGEYQMVSVGDLAPINSPKRSIESFDTELQAKLRHAMTDPLPLSVAGANTTTVEPTGQGQPKTVYRHSRLPKSLPEDLGLGSAKDALVKPICSNKYDSETVVEDSGDDALPWPNSSISAASESQKDNKEVPRPPAGGLMPPIQRPQLPTEPPEGPGSRDRYGFRKANAYITREQYDGWAVGYDEYLARRRRKWVAFLQDHSLITDGPTQFPQRSNKAKRFVRKGIPPNWRGAAWFYYAGGPSILAKHPGVYDDLVKRAGLNSKTTAKLAGGQSEVNGQVAEDIEKDLHRTFPDNVRFKPPPTAPSGGGPDWPSTVSDSQVTLTEVSPHHDGDGEPEIITSLRRVLYAFALYNPRIGYCQSLNFLAGMLLLFVETEEHAFWLLNVITRVYLPGTHEMSLEGSKVDLGVLMVALQDSLPHVWRQIAMDEVETAGVTAKKTRAQRAKDALGRAQQGPAHDPNRLPAITLCMTAWFMSCFIGTLPVETVLRVWDVFFYEGSRTLFRIALAIFKVGEAEIRKVSDPMEMFGVVQALPRRLLDPNALMETCYKRRNGIGHLSQDVVEEKRQERREGIRRWKAEQDAEVNMMDLGMAGVAVVPAAAGLDLISDVDDAEARQKGPTLFGKRRERDKEQLRAAEVV